MSGSGLVELRQRTSSRSWLRAASSLPQATRFRLMRSLPRSRKLRSALCCSSSWSSAICVVFGNGWRLLRYCFAARVLFGLPYVAVIVAAAGVITTWRSIGSACKWAAVVGSVQ